MTGIVLLSIATTAIATAFSDRATTMITWPLCSLRPPKLTSVTNYIITSLSGLVFVVGVIIFAVCNASIIHLLWTYHSRRENFVLKEISDAIGSAKRNTKKQPTSSDKNVNKNHQCLVKVNPHCSSRNYVRDNERTTPLTDVCVVRQDTIEVKTSNGRSPGNGTEHIRKRIIDNETHVDTSLDLPHTVPDTISISGSANTGAADMPRPATIGGLSEPQINKHFTKRHSNQADSVICKTPFSLFADVKSRRNSESDLGLRQFDHAKYTKILAPDVSSEEPMIQKSCSDTDETITSNHTTTTTINKDGDDSKPVKQIDMLTSGVDAAKYKADAHIYNVTNYIADKCTSTNKCDTNNALLPESQQVQHSDDTTAPCCVRTRSVQLSYVQRQLGKLHAKVRKSLQKQRREIVLARMVLMCSIVFLLTWIPHVVSTSMKSHQPHHFTKIRFNKIVIQGPP